MLEDATRVKILKGKLNIEDCDEEKVCEFLCKKKASNTSR